MQSIRQIYKKLLLILSLPIILQEYFSPKTGAEYKIGFLKKMILILKMARNNKKIPTASDVTEHLTMATKILSIPKTLEGCVVECGTYYGASASNLSLVCTLTGRKLEVFDSFAGLPKPSKHDAKHKILDLSQIHSYTEGAWSATLTEVKDNITRFGEIKICNFHVGFFKKTLPMFNKKCVFVFLDVDLVDSVKTCLKYLWPKLGKNCYLFTHEAHHMGIASLFFDKIFWQKNLNSTPPGLVGAGSGLGLIPETGAFKSSLGYTVKNPNVKKFKIKQQTGK